MKKKQVAAILALLLGIFGVHRFYLGQRKKAILYFGSFIIGIFFIAFDVETDISPLFFIIPAIVGLIDSVLFFVMPKEEFNYKYNDVVQPWSNSGISSYENSLATAVPLSNKQKGIQQYQLHDYHAAILDFQKALDQEYNDPSVHLHLACCYSILEEKDNAFFHLDKAVDFGLDINQISTQQALTYIRNHQDFDSFAQNGYQIGSGSLVPPSFPLSTDANTTTDALEKIAGLGELRDKGFLTEEEFSMQKQRLLLPRE